MHLSESPAVAPPEEVHLPRNETLQKLRVWMASFRSVIVAYSGGVDSALVLAIAHECLGPGALGCIGVSPSYPQRELEAATGLAEQRGLRYRLVNTQEHLDARYAANPGNRCYFCKSELYDRLSLIRAEIGADAILDGTNASDLTGHRPGYAAAQERGVRSPLAELGIDKQNVRELARLLDLPVWDKPASPCLASRVPTGVAIVPMLLSRIEKAEDVLAALGFRDFRVRHHGDMARIELPVDALATAVEKREAIVEGVRAAGYRYVSVDLGGLKSGSLSG
jgi:pyridinium-3,5-biscarboxylic acid mononucleotide sulfurtransferase